jgi:hypothetical protein
MTSLSLHQRCVPLLLATLLALAAGPVRAQPAPEPTTPQERLSAAVKALGNDPRLKKLSPAYLQKATEFVVGNSLFVVLHELAHAATSMMKIPILGRREGAADIFAVIQLIKLDNAFTDGVLDAAANGWFMSDRRDKKTGETLLFYDEHGLNQQRAYQIVCLMVGSGEEKYQALADQVKLPKDRQKSCRGDFFDALEGWDAALMPHMRAPDQPKTQIDVVYGEGKGDLDIIAKVLSSIGLLEAVVDRAASAYAWPAPFTLEARTCGFVNAAWDSSTHKLTLCYELAFDFVDLYREYGDIRQSGRKRRSAK